MRDVTMRVPFCRCSASPPVARRAGRTVRLATVLVAVAVGCGLGVMAPSAGHAGEVLEFSGPGCLACQRMSPMVEKLKRQGYPIRVLDAEQVRVLIRSRELGERYGEEAIAVVFPHGKGEVFHMISHYYLQRTELRKARHEQSAASYASEKLVTVDAETSAMMADLNLGDVESAESSTRLMANLIADKKRRMMGRRQDG